MSTVIKGHRVTVYVETDDGVTAIVLPSGGELTITDDIVTLAVNVEFPVEAPYELWFGVEPPADPAQEVREN